MIRQKEQQILEYKKELGLTNHEIKVAFEKHASTSDPEIALDRLLSDLKSLIFDNPSVIPVTHTVLKAARLELELTQKQMAKFIGHKITERTRTHMERLESGERPITEVTTRIVRAYLSGHRPPDWPGLRDTQETSHRAA